MPAMKTAAASEVTISVRNENEGDGSATWVKTTGKEGGKGAQQTQENMRKQCES
jgi:hypothetical protein